MSLLPTNVFPSIAQTVQSASLPSLTFGVNHSAGQITFGLNGLDAVKQAVWIALGIQRYAWQIYSPNFGDELTSLIGKPSGMVLAEVPRMIQDALSIDDRISSVDGFNLVQVGDSLQVNFTVHSVYGDFTTITTVVL
jgi:hypothetical protein